VSTRVLVTAFATLLSITGTAQAAQWQVCGDIRDFNVVSCEFRGRPAAQWEYGIPWNSPEPLPSVCVTWNRGIRIHNKEPHFVNSDNPTIGQRWGGFVFYQGTDASDDNVCTNGLRHRYWVLDTNNIVTMTSSNGCFFTHPVYCRRR
jgi:hypothetical protein